MDPEIVSFTATPKVISPGQTVTVAWETHGVTSVTVAWAPESNPRGHMQRRAGLPPSGATTFQPQEPTAFVLECDPSPGQMCTAASATVRMR